MASLLCKLSPTLKRLANAADIDVRRENDGSWTGTKKSDRAFVGRWTDEGVARAFLQSFIDTKGQNITPGPMPFNGNPAAANPSRIQEVLSPTREKLAVLGIGPTIVTPIKNFAQNLEKLGRGLAYSVVYEIPQKAMDEVSRQISIMPRKIFANAKNPLGRSFQAAIHDLNKAVSDSGLTNLEKEEITLWHEAFSKEEIEFRFTMNQDEVNASAGLSALNTLVPNVASNIPIYVRINAIIDDFLVNRDRTINQLIPSLRNDIIEGKLPPSLKPDLDRLEQVAGTEDTVDKVLTAMGYTQDERIALDNVRGMIDGGKVRVPVVYRHATAKNLDPRFANGRDQFASEHGMKPIALKIAQDRAGILQESFMNHSLSADTVIGLQLPIMRQFIDAGIFPGKNYGIAPAQVNKYAKILDSLSGSDILTRRVLSGHINPYELNPVVTTSKHVRNMFMLDHFDPIVKQVKDAIKNIPDERAQEIMTNYVHELMGLPDENFKWLTNVIRTMARVTGQKVDDRFAERLVNNLNFLTSGASIPFRPALILRNAYQIMLPLARIGPESWAEGLGKTMGRDKSAPSGFSMKVARDAYNEAVKGGAIKPNVIPIHAGNEAMESAAQFLGSLGPELSKVGYRVSELFDAGFSLYRKSDDFGRVAAFHAGKSRVAANLPEYMKTHLANPKSALEKLKISSKVKTFDETIEVQFEQLIQNGDYELAKDLIGKQLADDTFFLYGDANHPPGWTGVKGKLLGQFGTFPVQYLQYLGRGMTKGTARDRIEFAAIHSATNIGIVVAGDELLNTDLTSWAFWPSLTYSGGPYAGAAINIFQLYSGSDAERSLAGRNLRMMFPTWDHPRSIFLPGSFAIGDLVEAFREDDFVKMLSRGAGFREMRAGQKTFVDRAFEWMDW